MTATRQATVRENHNWSLENLRLRLVTDETFSFRNQSYFVLKSLILQGASWTNGKLFPSPNKMEALLPPFKFIWECVDTEEPNKQSNMISVPVY